MAGQFLHRRDLDRFFDSGSHQNGVGAFLPGIGNGVLRQPCIDGSRLLRVVSQPLAYDGQRYPRIDLKGRERTAQVVDA